MSEIIEMCTKCGERPRAKSHAWCKICQKTARTAGADALISQKNEEIARLKTLLANRPDADAGPKKCAECAGLRAQVAELKRDLEAARLRQAKPDGAEEPRRAKVGPAPRAGKAETKAGSQPVRFRFGNLVEE